MKIVSYNINDSKSWKLNCLLAMDADVLVVPEITCPEDAHLPADHEMKWYGVEYFYREKKWKGLGVIWKKGAGHIPDWINPGMTYSIPLIIEDYLILGFWPTRNADGSDKRTYPQIAQEMISEYASHFKEYKTIIIGDFNCYVGQSGSKKYGDMLRVNEILESLGLHSLYHQQKCESLGKETIPTFYFRFQESEPFFLDYAYTNFPVSSFRMLPWDKEMSDHIGLEVII